MINWGTEENDGWMEKPSKFPFSAGKNIHLCIPWKNGEIQRLICENNTVSNY